MKILTILKNQTSLSVLAARSQTECEPCRVFMRSSNRESGFTLIELIIVITILGVLTSIALPAFSGFISDQRIKTASFDIISTLMLARSEALKRNTIVTVTPVGGKWSDGWTVTATVGGATTTINRQAAYKKLTINGSTSLRYNGSGRLAAATTPFEISSSDSSGVRCISIDLSGRPNSKKEAC